MIESVTVRDLGVIVSADIELGPGLTVITGETGAGKTMLLTGLGLLFGDRADPSRVRHGCRQAMVEGMFSIEDADLHSRLDEIVDEVGGQWDDGDRLIASRTVHAEGRSRAHLAGRSVPAGVLAGISDELVAVHGQGDQIRLSHSRHQREALDTFAGDDLIAALGDYRSVYAELKSAIAQRAEIQENREARQREAEDIAELLDEVDALELHGNDLEQLKDEAGRLGHVDEIAAAVDRALGLLRGEGSAEVESLLASAGSALDTVRSHDSRVADLHTRLIQSATEIADLVVELAGVADSLEADPQRLEWIEARRARITAALRRLSALTGEDSPGMGDLLAWAQGARIRLEELTDDAGLLESIDHRIDQARAQAGPLAARVSELRIAAARSLEARVTEELAALAMPTARLVVSITRRPPGEGLVVAVEGGPYSADRHGIDDVAFGLVQGADDRPRPLGRGSSGGERSRIMLALEVVLAGADPVPTMVFDEVDAGVGGRAAVEVGRRLARLGRLRQVLVVTHLPQVAAFADRHLVVRTDADGQITQASVATVEGDDRRRELARMLAGQEESDTAMAHAAELLELAAGESTGDTPEVRGNSTGASRR